MLTLLHSVTDREEYKGHKKYFLPLWKYGRFTCDSMPLSHSIKASRPLHFVFKFYRMFQANDSVRNTSAKSLIFHETMKQHFHKSS